MGLRFDIGIKMSIMAIEFVCLFQMGEKEEVRI